jgi:hypothetical protein
VKTLHELILQTLTQRIEWENRQRVWYQMIHEGLRRRRPPFAFAADMHFPLADGILKKFLPFFYNQIFQEERIAEFTAQSAELSSQCESAADFFNWEIRQNTDFEFKFSTAMFHMLKAGRGILKCYWDPFKNKLVIEAKDPLYFIVPRRTDSIEEADWFVDVKVLTRGQYEREPRYNQEKEVIKQILGGQNDGSQRSADQDKAFREGLTYSSNEDEIIVWEVYEKTKGGWTVYTYSPTRPKLELRKPFGVPYKMNGEYFPPFESFQMEVKDEGWYSPRGVVELLAPFESALCKLWNLIFDWLEYNSKPLFTSEDPVPPNMVNFRLGPGELLPKGIKPAVMPPVPREIIEQMQIVRSTAEQYVSVPDAGLAPDELKGNRGGDKSVTATQVNYQAGLGQTQIEMPARFVRKSCAKFFRKCWAILVQHKQGEIAYYSAGNRQVLPRQALAESYMIEPDGSPDSWNKNTRVQRATARLQLYRGDPAINQDNLKKDVLTADDPRLVKSLFIGQDVGLQQTGMDQILKILVMTEGYPVPVSPNDNHQVCIEMDLMWLHKQASENVPHDPAIHQAIVANATQHFSYLQKQNPAASKQLIPQIKQLESMGAQPPGVVQMPQSIQGQPAALQ